MKKPDQHGSILLIALGVISLVSLFAFAAFGNLLSTHAILRNSTNWQRTVAIADAGIESAIAALRKDADFQGEKDVAFDGGTFTTEVTKYAFAEDIRIIRSRCVLRPSRRRVYRKELLVAVRLSPSEVEILSRLERTPVH